jgi:hypothetical protein
VIEHKLGIDPSFKPIKQKKRRYTVERPVAIQQEVNRLLKVGFIRSIDYPSWLANLVLIEKSDGSWCMCEPFFFEKKLKFSKGLHLFSLKISLF